MPCISFLMSPMDFPFASCSPTNLFLLYLLTQVAIRSPTPARPYTVHLHQPKRYDGCPRIVAKPETVANSGCYGRYVLQGSANLNACNVIKLVNFERRCRQSFCNCLSCPFVPACNNARSRHFSAYLLRMVWT